MKLNYALFDPSGNTTALVSSPVPRGEQPSVAAQLMAKLGTEQAGFLEAPSLDGARARLQMMGGEFCGNASMSLAALLALRDKLAVGAIELCALEVSGAQGIVRCRVERVGARDFVGSASMPLPEAIAEFDLGGGLRAPLVRFPGIAHLILPEGALSPAEAERAIPRLCDALGADALGLLFRSEDGASLRPLVYVRSTRSRVWEHGCGSGTAALGAWEASRAGGDVELRASQPGGTIAVTARAPGGMLREIEISGNVRLVREGQIDL